MPPEEPKRISLATKPLIAAADLSADASMVAVSDSKLKRVSVADISAHATAGLVTEEEMQSEIQSIELTPGPIGEIGPQGIPGLKGDIGLPGNQGVKGDTGPQGEVGAQGPIGPIGPKGDIGNDGAIGATGSQGIKGDTGVSGAIGPQGQKGDSGAQGIQGLTGAKGDTGSIGATGVQGPKGDSGVTGTQGLSGVKGDKGDTGLQGATGAKGNDGPSGLLTAAAPLVYDPTAKSLNTGTLPTRFEVISGTASAAGSGHYTFATPFAVPPTITPVPVWSGPQLVSAEAANITINGFDVTIMRSKGTLLLSSGAFEAAPVGTVFKMLVIGR